MGCPWTAYYQHWSLVLNKQVDQRSAAQTYNENNSLGNSNSTTFDGNVDFV